MRITAIRVLPLVGVGTLGRSQKGWKAKCKDTDHNAYTLAEVVTETRAETCSFPAGGQSLPATESESCQMRPLTSGRRWAEAALSA